MTTTVRIGDHRFELQPTGTHSIVRHDDGSVGPGSAGESVARIRFPAPDVVVVDAARSGWLRAGDAVVERVVLPLEGAVQLSTPDGDLRFEPSSRSRTEVPPGVDAAPPPPASTPSWLAGVNAAVQPPGHPQPESGPDSAPPIAARAPGPPTAPVRRSDQSALRSTTSAPPSPPAPPTAAPPATPAPPNSAAPAPPSPPRASPTSPADAGTGHSAHPPSDPTTPIGRPDEAQPAEIGAAASSLEVVGVSVATRGVTRLDRVDLSMRSGDFIALLGSSGAGKSTLVKAITGTDPATDGFITMDGRDLYREFEALRARIGYVPQDDVLHPQLTIAETLEYASRLRFSPTVDDDVRSARVDAVIRELGLTDRAGARVDELSGGQRKRVNVAVELLTEPDLLILDEPTSGLDPGNERLMMELLRSLADAGRMVIAVTHSMESLHLCDSVLFLAPGGVPVFNGAPGDLPASLGVSTYTEVFTAVEALGDPQAHRVAPTRSVSSRPPSSATAASSIRDQVVAADRNELGRQFRILVDRYVRVLRSDRRSLLILSLQAPIIAVVMLAVFGSGHLDRSNGTPESGNVLMGLALATIYLGASNAVREIVKERPVLRREQNFGVSVVAYLASKFTVLGVVTAAQALVLVTVGLVRQDGPTDAVLLGQPYLELMLIVILCGLTALALGLAISAWASSADKAMTLLPVVLFLQFLLAGLIFPVSTPGVQQLSWLMASRWGFAGSAATVDFWSLRGCDMPIEADDCSRLWQHDGVNWLLSYSMLLVLLGAALFAAWKVIVRSDPVQVLASAGR